jgi:hypothetical protein
VANFASNTIEILKAIGDEKPIGIEIGVSHQ